MSAGTAAIEGSTEDARLSDPSAARPSFLRSFIGKELEIKKPNCTGGNLLTSYRVPHPRIYEMQQIVYLIALVLLSGCQLIPSFNQMPQSEEWIVVNVQDGDTLTVGGQGREERIRLCGIDAPELDQPLGEESKSHLQQLLSATSDRILLTPLERDQYGRVVAEVDTLETHKFVQYEMLLAGMAYVYDRYVDSCPNANFMHEAEAMAQQQRLGVWSGNYQKPWDYRRSQ